MKIHCCRTVSTNGILASNIKRRLLGRPVYVTIRLLGHFICDRLLGHSVYVTIRLLGHSLYVTIRLLGHSLYVTDYWDTLYM